MRRPNLLSVMLEKILWPRLRKPSQDKVNCLVASKLNGREVIYSVPKRELELINIFTSDKECRVCNSCSSLIGDRLL
jgi:hypothetical protein